MRVDWRKADLTTGAELDGIVELMRRFYAEDLHLPLTEAQARGTLRELAQSPSAGAVYVAHGSGAPAPLAGYALVVRYLSNEFGGYVGYLDEFFLLHGYRGLGNGSRFLAGLEDVAESLGLAALWLETDPDNRRAQRLYERMGFVKSERILMRRPLGDQGKPLRDLVDFGLQVLFVGYNPSLRSAAVGHHFAGHANRFWELLFRSGLTPARLRPEEDRSLLALGFGVTNLIDRPTRAIDELARDEFVAGAADLRRRVETLRPRTVAHVGKDVYPTYAGTRRPVQWGRQETAVVPGVVDFVLPNPSGLNRMTLEEQVGYYRELGVYLRTRGEHLGSPGSLGVTE